MAEKIRLDMLLVERGLAETRTKAKAMVMAGSIRIDGVLIDKSGVMVSPDCRIELVGQPSPFVSRGGQKLAKAVDKFGIDLSGRIVLDVGASTGGFTDCCLQKGAAVVYSVDVGYGQLAWQLRNDPRVVNLERTNIRKLEPVQFTEGKPDFSCIDVAFISLTLVVPVIYNLGVRELVMLIKPQFEAGRALVGKKGVVRQATVHRMVIDKVLAKAEELGFVLWNLDFSPIKGPQGNIEYLAHGFFSQAPNHAAPNRDQVVAAAHAYFS